jgi:Trk-type K+ transport system membrane component
MHFAMIAKILGLLIMVFSFTMLPPIIVSWWFQDGNSEAFFISYGVTLLLGIAIWMPFMRSKAELQTRDGFLVVTLFWTVLGIIGALPIGLTLDVSITDAVFESVSGLTTTGATVLSGLDSMPQSLLFWRQQLQWLGGMGVIVLAIAILPMLGIGGMQLYKAEIPGPMKESKLTPRIAETAKALWLLYLLVTILALAAFDFQLDLLQLWQVSLVLLIFTTLSLSIPATPGYVGTYHTAVLTALLLFHIDSNQARSFAIVLHLMNYLIYTPIGAWYLMKAGLSLDLANEENLP